MVVYDATGRSASQNGCCDHSPSGVPSLDGLDAGDQMRRHWLPGADV
jgi:hypothetical protein